MTRAPVKKRPKQERDDAALIRRLRRRACRRFEVRRHRSRFRRGSLSLKAKAAGKTLKRLDRRTYTRWHRSLAASPKPRPISGISCRRIRHASCACSRAIPMARSRRCSRRPTRRAAAARSPSDVMRILRRMKAEAALLDRAHRYRWCVARCPRDRRLDRRSYNGAPRRRALSPGHSRKGEEADAGGPGNPAAGSGYIVLAMGKMGAHELDFSSDIDLMVFFDAGAAKLKPGLEPMSFYVGLTRDLVKILQERTPDGYVFRVDLRLRPDPASTQIAISADAALDYYESRGQNWERAALIKARPCAGDTCNRREPLARSRRPLSGANISITPPSGTCTR